MFECDGYEKNGLIFVIEGGRGYYSSTRFMPLFPDKRVPFIKEGVYKNAIVSDRGKYGFFTAEKLDSFSMSEDDIAEYIVSNDIGNVSCVIGGTLGDSYITMLYVGSRVMVLMNLGNGVECVFNYIVSLFAKRDYLSDFITEMAVSVDSGKFDVKHMELILFNSYLKKFSQLTQENKFAAIVRESAHGIGHNCMPVYVINNSCVMYNSSKLAGFDANGKFTETPYTGIDIDDIIKYSKTLLKGISVEKVPWENIADYMVKNHINAFTYDNYHESDDILLKSDINAFGQSFSFLTFNPASFDPAHLSDEYGQKVDASFTELEELRKSLGKRCGTSMIDQLRLLSVKNILGFGNRYQI